MPPVWGTENKWSHPTARKGTQGRGGQVGRHAEGGPELGAWDGPCHLSPFPESSRTLSEAGARTGGLGGHRLAPNGGPGTSRACQRGKAWARR